MTTPSSRALACLVAAAAFARAAAAETRRALLVGVSRYPEQCGWPSLPGVAGDVELVQKTLLARGFASKDVVVLHDQQATRKAILEELDHLAAKSQPGDLALFYFAGHGSRLPDQGKKDELDPYDETIVPFDAGTSPDKANDIRDDQIGAWIARANQHTDQVVLVFDCCSSGTVTRGGGGQQRYLDPGTRGFDLPRASFVPPEAAASSGWAQTGRRYVALSACRANQSAYEIVLPPEKVGGKERVHGAFTWQFANALAELGPEATYGDVLARVSAGLREPTQRQTPVIEGCLATYRLFANEAAPDARRYALERAEDGNWRLLGGRIDALTEGALLAIDPAEARHDAGSTRIGRARVERAGRETSTIAWVEGEPDAAGPRALTAFLLEPGKGGARLAIAVEGDDSAAQELERRLEATNLLFPCAIADADYVLARERGPTRERWVLQSRRGRALPITAALSSQEEVGKLVDGLARLALARRTRALLEGDATNALAVEFTARAAAVGEDAPKELERTPAGEWRTPADGHVSIEVRNGSAVALSVALLWIGPDGEVSWVGGNSQEETVPPGAVFAIPETELGLPPGREAFYADAPVEIVCVASPRWHDFGPLFQDGAPITTARGGGTAGTQVDPLACEGWTARVLRFALAPAVR